MHRLVIALTTLLALIGAAVVAGYLFVFGASTDRTAQVTPATAVGYVSVHLTPSTGQQMNLAEVMSRLPGFSDRAALGTKLDELAQRFLGDAGLDYHADVKPWLGDELALAAMPAPGQAQVSAASGSVLVVAQVKDRPEADAAIGRIIAKSGSAASSEVYQGVTIRFATGAGGAIAVVDDMLLAASTRETVRAAIDAAQGRADSLGDESRFRAAMDRLPADRLAAAYLDIGLVTAVAMPGAAQTGLGAASVALVAEPGGVQVVGGVPFDRGAAPSALTSTVEQLAGASGLSAWMPEDTEAELVFFGAQSAFNAIVSQLGSVPGGSDLQQSLTQLRALAALGLGIDIDRDLLPLFDRDAAVAVQQLSATQPHGQLLLRPSDPAAAADALARVSAALTSRGATVTQAQVSGTTVTSMTVPQVGQVAYAVTDGVVLLGLSQADVAAALSAHASGQALAGSVDYTGAYRVAGARSGDELYVAGARVADLIGGFITLPADVRDILTHVSALAIAIGARGDEIEIHATVTVH